MNYKISILILLSHVLLVLNAWAQVIEPPIIESISIINETGDVRINWIKSPEPLAEGYIIYQYIGDFQGINTIQIDVVDEETTEYTVTGTETGSQAIAYVIAAYRVDEGDTIRSALTEPHKTIYASVNWDPCVAENTIEWTPYEGWEDELHAYQVVWYLRGQTDTTSGSLLDPLIYSDKHLSPPFNLEVCYLVRAFHEGGYESLSNRVCILTSVKVPPAWINATGSFVNEENHVELVFHPDPNTQTEKYLLYRSQEPNGPFAQASVLSQFPPSAIHYTDEEVFADRVNYYKLVALNECDLEGTASNLASNILLNSHEERGIVSLNWNQYETWTGGIDRFEVYRLVDSQLPQLAATLPGLQTSFSEDLNDFTQAELSGIFCYFVRAFEGNANPYGFSGESRSNQTCVTLEPEIFIPDAFTPDGDGRNDFFKVFFSFIPASYHMIVYDRWRNPVFESRDPQRHWDGTFSNGRKAPEGIYTYLLLVETQGGKKVRKTGQLALIYP